MFATSAASTPWSLPCPQSAPRRSRLWSVVFPDYNGDFIYCRTTIPASNICSICAVLYIEGSKDVKRQRDACCKFMFGLRRMLHAIWM
jgi:hypothetical protein